MTRELNSLLKSAAAEPLRLSLRLSGRLQGIGFRPHVARTAGRLGLTGRVANTGGEVRIEAQGPGERVRAFVDALLKDPPPGAEVRAVASDTLPVRTEH
ncbi:MAG: acylphosphatase, partial [Planctomycetota bacterium]